MSNLTVAARDYAEAKTALDAADKHEHDTYAAAQLAAEERVAAQSNMNRAAKALSAAALAEVA